MIFTTNKLQDIKSLYKKELALLYTANEINIFMQMLCEHILLISKEKYILNDNLYVNESDLLKFNFALKDLIKQKPIQYILGKTFFYGLPFNVSPNVLIPRPETEELVELIIKENPSFNGHLLDIGTGSGCIAISLKNNFTEAQVTAIDISTKALEIANQNALINKTAVDFIQVDILQPTSAINTQFTVIVSNPPYILVSEKKLMQKNVLDYEPACALFVDDINPLIFYKAIADFALIHLVENGKLYFEINETQGEGIIEYLTSIGFKECLLVKDLFNKNRFVRCIK